VVFNVLAVSLRSGRGLHPSGTHRNVLRCLIERNAERDFHGERRRNDTHASTTDPDARLLCKGRGKEAKLCHMGHLLMENRSGRRRSGDPGHRHCRARCSRGHVEAPDGPASSHARRRQGLRRGRLCRAGPGPERHAAHCPEHRAPLGDRWPDHAPSRLLSQPAGPQANRGSLRLDQDGGRPAQDPPPRHRAGRLDVHADRRGLQSGASAQAAAGGLIMPGLRPERCDSNAKGQFHIS
jgi:hypothetical protein